jgi:transcriptional regulator with XRE-family HTH domain
LAFL